MGFNTNDKDGEGLAICNSQHKKESSHNEAQQDAVFNTQQTILHSEVWQDARALKMGSAPGIAGRAPASCC